MQPSSPFPGVGWVKHVRKWKAKGPRSGGKQQSLGYFVKEADAAAAAKAGPRAVERKPSSSHRGVYWRKGRGKWVAEITIGGKKKRLGRFGDEAAAAAAYRRAAAERGPARGPPAGWRLQVAARRAVPESPSDRR